MRKSLPYIAGLSLILIVLNACAPQKPALQQVRDAGVLHVVTRNAATTYYTGPHGAEGLEYDLVKAFAIHLGVSLKISTEDNLQDLLDKVQDNKVAFAAAGLTVTPEREKIFRFSNSYQSITQQLVYHRSIPRPKTMDDTVDGMLEVIANSSHVEKLNELKKKHPELSWDENKAAGTTELLTLVAERVIDFTIADSNEVLLTRRFQPNLRIAFDISKPQKLAWAFSKNGDDSLYEEANRFLRVYKKSGQLALLLKRNYNHASNYNYAGTPTYLGHVRYRLPRYQEMFERAGEANDLDWQLLAAVAYQESHWNPRAVSPTGVRGIMMLTNLTAKDLGVEDRTIPEQSINGGAKYLRELSEKFSEKLDEKDRLWFTLAAYNVGFGHVQDARIITKRRGGNPDRWVDVKQSLPLLRNKRWYKKTRFGYARGNEPVKYVENIRSYYDILHWHLAQEKQQDRKVAFVSPAL
ncbi:MAG: membrane-bound lytic murein transglycosylase MltF [Gammaproteobacteria bacterium]|nr:membrane-bound lytic murein transglycosylase MltF [Gammaproteobacteria bacterium]